MRGRAAERRFLVEVSQLARGGSSIVPWSADLAASRADRPRATPEPVASA